VQLWIWGTGRLGLVLEAVEKDEIGGDEYSVFIDACLIPSRNIWTKRYWRRLV